VAAPIPNFGVDNKQFFAVLQVSCSCMAFCRACTTFPHDLRFFPQPEDIVSSPNALVHLSHTSGWRISTGWSMTPICKSLATARVKSLGLQSIPQRLCNCDTTFTRASILLVGPGASSLPGWSCRSGRRSPDSRRVFPGFRHHFLPSLAWQPSPGHSGHQLADTNVVDGKWHLLINNTALYGLGLQRHFHLLTSQAERYWLSGEEGGGPTFPYSATSSNGHALTIHNPLSSEVMSLILESAVSGLQ